MRNQDEGRAGTEKSAGPVQRADATRHIQMGSGGSDRGQVRGSVVAGKWCQKMLTDKDHCC